MQSSQDAAPQRQGYWLDAHTGTAGLTGADAWHSANFKLQLHRPAQAAGTSSCQQAQTPAQASAAHQGHPSPGICGHAAPPAGAAPVAAPAPPVPEASTLPDSQEEGQSRAQSQTQDRANHVPAQQALGVPVVALQHGAAVWERADMLPSLVEREVPAPWVQRPASKMRPLAELQYTDKVGRDAHLPCCKVQTCCVMVCQHQESAA